MKQAIIALSLAIISSSVIANATTTVPKSKRDSGGDITFDNAAKRDPVLHRIVVGDDRIIQDTPIDPGKNLLDFNAVEGLSTPIDVPISGDELGRTVHISTSADSAAQVVEDLTSYSADTHEVRDVLAVNGDMQITFPENITAASLLYEADGHESKFAANPTFSLSIVLLDADGNLVRSETVVGDPSAGTNWNALQITSSVPFQKIVLTPSNDQVWFISKAAVEAVKQEAPDESTASKGTYGTHVRLGEQGLSSGTIDDSDTIVDDKGLTAGTVNEWAPGFDDTGIQSGTIDAFASDREISGRSGTGRTRYESRQAGTSTDSTPRTDDGRIEPPSGLESLEAGNKSIATTAGLTTPENEIDAPIRSGSGLATPENVADGQVSSASGL